MATDFVIYTAYYRTLISGEVKIMIGFSSRCSDRLSSFFSLICPRCEAELKLMSDRFLCTACGSDYHERNNSVDFVGPYLANADSNDLYLQQLTEGVMRTLAFPAEAAPFVASAVRDTNKRTGISHIDAEIASLASRLGLTQVTEAVAVGPMNVDLDIKYVRHYVENTIPSAALIQRTVRIRNASAFTISSNAEFPLNMSYHWLNKNNEFEVFDGVRTIIPVDVAGGREISLVMTFETPSQPGKYILRILPVEEGKQWHENMSFDVPILIVETTQQSFQNFSISPHGRSYGDDHADAVRFLERFMRIRYGSEKIKLLEVGAGIHPQTSHFARDGHIVVSSDVCTNLCQLGSLYFHFSCNNNLGDALNFVSFDVSRPPFAAGQFDGVVMFSTLHHFPEPEAFLRKLARLVRPSGFMAALCEPWGPDPTAAEYRRDLALGINEQWFTLEEYTSIFHAAGVTPIRMQLDGGSLKAILTEHNATYY